jgi:membrane-associated phospholipid phosphatase
MQMFLCNLKKIFLNIYAKILLCIILPLIAIFYSYKYLDKKVAMQVKFFLLRTVTPEVNSVFLSYKILLGAVIQSDVIFFYAAQVAIVLCFLLPSKFKQAAFTRSISITSLGVILTYLLKDALKMIFGRCCAKPLTNSTFLINTILGDKNALFFRFFHGNINASLFPSGHMAVTCALVTSLCIYFPKYAILWLLFGLLMGTSLILTNNHFLSDVLSGALLGALTSYFTYKLFEKHVPTNWVTS